ncbi:hypothetical protein MBRA1_000759 [Malassezia brasiliensis]|uniref:Signal recognition particle subunit SRP14 n=1 Tax=Malassezia brasiliensis TaxID=1821822 RepID=A0AAF0IMM0_9BASI|nr:hypothetical protein MBRA1_000759 [Malassezia brasiliensis]
MRVAPSEFLAKLTTLFASASEKHTVYVTVKRAEASNPAPLLYRATDGKTTGKTKLSTVVPPSELPTFEQEYLTLMRTQLASMLKKRDKAKERRVDKILAASRKKLDENDGKVRITGAKRGAGRRKRMRALHRAQRLRQARSRT